MGLGSERWCGGDAPFRLGIHNQRKGDETRPIGLDAQQQLIQKAWPGNPTMVERSQHELWIIRQLSTTSISSSFNLAEPEIFLYLSVLT